uniref:ACT domain-containing protein ACR n=1 Tax=Solanum tuberosum TaxID=4113 RepID=M1B4F9_SOLTU
MAVAMASCGSISGVYANLNAIEKISISSSVLFRGSFGLDPVQRICLVPKRLAFSESTIIPKASSTAAVEEGSSQDTAVPTPKVIIDLDSDPEATVVEVTFGDRLGALLDTMSALKNLGLNVVKANVYLDSSGKHNKLCITHASTGRKVEDPELLEAIRLTIINNLMEFHPVALQFQPSHTGYLLRVPLWCLLWLLLLTA